MSVPRDRPWRWEVQGRFPGHRELTKLLGCLRRVREERADPALLAKWVELGPDDPPPWVPANLDDARDPRRSEVAASSLEPADPLIIDSVALLERALKAAEAGDDPKPILRFTLETLRRAKELGLAAKQLGLAGVGSAGIAISVLMGGEPAVDHRPRRREPSKNISGRMQPTLRVLVGGAVRTFAANVKSRLRKSGTR